MTDTALQSILDDLRREPSRTPSVVVTVFGDAILPRGGSVWLGTLLAFFGTIGIADGAVRTAVSRLAAEGWLARERIGRNSHYRLAEKGRATFEAATRAIYNPRPIPFDGGLTLVVLDAADPGREAARAALEAAGFGSPAPSLWIAPGSPAIPDAAAGAVALQARAGVAEAVRLAGQAWRLDRLAGGYRRFLATFAPFAAVLRSGARPSDADAFAARIMLIHSFRRVALRDPDLPPALLPEGWPGAEARSLCARLYGDLLDGSERWLDANGANAAGSLPHADASLRARFQL